MTPATERVGRPWALALGPDRAAPLELVHGCPASARVVRDGSVSCLRCGTAVPVADIRACAEYMTAVPDGVLLN